MAVNEELTLANYVKDEETRKIFSKVFDRATIESLHYLAQKHLFDFVEFVISTGKEAHVFRAIDKSKNFRAVKIYKISTTNFKRMDHYIIGDERFTNLKKDRRSIVYAWAKKEYKNLEIASAAGVRVPLPLGFMNNILVMEFIGKDGVPAPLLKNCQFEEKDYKKIYKKIIDYVARLLYKAEMVHADISEYNILMNGKEPVLIDIGQAVLITHPQARLFFERDAANIARYFSKKGIDKTTQDVIKDIEALKYKYFKKDRKPKILEIYII